MVIVFRYAGLWQGPDGLVADFQVKNIMVQCQVKTKTAVVLIEHDLPMGTLSAYKFLTIRDKDSAILMTSPIQKNLKGFPSLRTCGRAGQTLKSCRLPQGHSMEKLGKKRVRESSQTGLFSIYKRLRLWYTANYHQFSFGIVLDDKEIKWT